MDITSLISAPIRLDASNFTHNTWGGDWIPRFKGLPPTSLPVGESWEFSAHRDRPNRVRLPEGKEVPLNKLLSQHSREILGSSAVPFLLKFIDPEDDLSIQVHPSDSQAKSLESDSGKSEAWIILESGPPEKGSCIYLGFNPEKTSDYYSTDEFAEAFLKAISQANSMGPILESREQGKAARLVLPFLNRIRVKAGDVYRVSPGTIHAIGKGARLFEIQETSDITYRLWDWNRPDAAKLKENKVEFRPLHLDKARRVLDFTAKDPVEYQFFPRTLAVQGNGNFREELIFEEQERRFSVNRITLESESEVQVKSIGAFFVLTCIEGSVKIHHRPWTGDTFASWGDVRQGHSVLIPAGIRELRIESINGPATVLKSYVPV